jgi:hypothetical protein
MARTKVTAYVTPDIADTLKRVAATDDRSVSDIIEDAVARRFADFGREAEHAALMAKLEQLTRRLGAIEKGQETHFELTAQAARFAMSVAPEIPEADRVALNARGADRFRNILSAIVARLSSGRSTWRDTLAAQQSPAPTQTYSAAAE